MKNPNLSQSELWAHINDTYITPDQVQDLSDFKSNAVNFKLSLWNPHTNGVRYLKALIYNLCMSLSNEDWERIAKTRNRQVGNPISVYFNGEDVCLDYLQAALELGFIVHHLPEDLMSGSGAMPSILEIGAGYGRTCHTIISNHLVKTYTIVDLENCLLLSKRYLREVLDDWQFSKIHFVSTKEIDQLDDLGSFDLCINIDSFAEMDSKVVEYYLDYIGRRCSFLYVKNPVGKYLDPSLSTTRDQKEVQWALSTGVLREVIDIHDHQAIQQQIPNFIQAYRPGETWELVQDGWALPWSYYWQALYKKGSGSWK